MFDEVKLMQVLGSTDNLQRTIANVKDAALNRDALRQTSFAYFSNDPYFDDLREKIIKPILRCQPDGVQLKVWVAACKNGDEAYGTAIMLDEAMRELGIVKDYKVFATDIDRSAIATAGQGFFPKLLENHISQERLQRYFVPKGNGYRISRDIRTRIAFCPFDFLSRSNTKIDFAVCKRSLAEEYTPQTQRMVLDSISMLLKPGCMLYSSSLDVQTELSDSFTKLDIIDRIYVRSGSAAAVETPEPRSSLDIDDDIRVFTPHSERTAAVREVDEERDSADSRVIANLEARIETLLARNYELSCENEQLTESNRQYKSDNEALREQIKRRSRTFIENEVLMGMLDD